MSKLHKAVLALQNKDFETAKQLYAEILKSNPNNAQALHYYGVIEAEKNQNDSGLHYMEKSLSIEPGNPVFNHNIAGFYSRHGLVEKAIHHFRQAIQFKPDYGEAYQGLTESMLCKNESALLKKIEKQLRLNKTPSSQKVFLHFSAAKICADSENYDLAFSHYKQANKLKGASFDIERDKEETQAKVKYFNENWVTANKEFGLYDHAPIFIVGMPRSGSTLTEQILATHTSVFSVGEINDIESIAKTLKEKTKNKLADPFFLSETSAMDLLGLGLSYLKKFKFRSENKEYFIDKNPLNFKHIGLILLMFPNAKIIHTNRNPLDTCLSCYFQNFTSDQDYSFNLANLAAFYNNYQLLMDHWKKQFPDKIFELSYEQLVSQQEKVTKELLNFCELPWESQCLDFHKTERQIKTVSKFQVRQPIHKKAVQKWKHYETHIQQLIKDLNYKS